MTNQQFTKDTWWVLFSMASKPDMSDGYAGHEHYMTREEADEAVKRHLEDWYTHYNGKYGYVRLVHGIEEYRQFYPYTPVGVA